MARGWESKAVEAQIESAEDRRGRAQGVPPLPERLQRERERDSLELSRTKLLNDINSASNPRYIEQLRAALRHIEDKMASLA
jgi:hypothetical protein